MRALAFSGGKDSWACLWLHKHELDDITVLWVNTGKNYPEALASIEQAKRLCPRFVTILVDRDGQNAYWGLPADVVPVDWTRLGQEVAGVKPVMVQPYTQCCYENIGSALQTYCERHGIVELIRGQRLDDAHKGTSRDGDVVNGVTYRHPIENWTAAEVRAYLAERMELPAHFDFEQTSLDCYDCTAFAAHSKDRVAWAAEKHPELHAAYLVRKTQLSAALAASIKDL